MKISKLFEGSDSMCREMLWEAGTVVLTIETVRDKEAFLPGRAKGEVKPHLFFRGITPGIVISGGKLKFLVRSLGGTDTDQWKGRQVALYVDKSIRDRKGSGNGSIQFALGPDFWARGAFSGKDEPPREVSGEKWRDGASAPTTTPATPAQSAPPNPDDDGR